MSKPPVVPSELPPLHDGRLPLSAWTQAELAAAGVPALAGVMDEAPQTFPQESPANLRAMPLGQRKEAVKAAGIELARRELLEAHPLAPSQAVATERAELFLLRESLDNRHDFMAAETGAGQVTGDDFNGGMLSVALGGALAADGTPLVVSLAIERFTADCVCEVRTLERAGADLADHLLQHAGTKGNPVTQGELTVAIVGHSIMGKSMNVVLVQAFYDDTYVTVRGDKKGLKQDAVQVQKTELGTYFTGLLTRSFG